MSGNDVETLLPQEDTQTRGTQTRGTQTRGTQTRGTQTRGTQTEDIQTQETPTPGLPVELWQMIFCCLCVHCTEPGCFPNADFDDTILFRRSSVENKSALATLCRVSKTMREIAEPILYHYFATGNMTYDIDKLPDWSARCCWGWWPELDHLPSFIRTLRNRPELASHVKALQLVDWCNYIHVDWLREFGLGRRDVGWPDVEPYSDEALRWWADVPFSNVLDIHYYETYVHSDSPFYNLRWPPYGEAEAHHWLQDILIALVHNVEAILLCRSFWPSLRRGSSVDANSLKPAFTLTKLRKLAFVDSNPYNRWDLWPAQSFGPTPHPALLAAAVNLEEFYCILPNLSDTALLGGAPETVTKIVSDDIHFSRGEFPLGAKVKDADLRLYKVDKNEKLHLEARLLNNKACMKRLILTIERPSASDSHQLTRHSWTYTRGLFSGFSALTELGIDLHGVWDIRMRFEADALAALLPDGIQTLHLMEVTGKPRVMAAVKRQLLELPNVKALGGSRFRGLTKVTVFYYWGTAGWNSDVRMGSTRRDLFNVFEDVGIQLEFVLGPRGRTRERGRILIPGAVETRKGDEYEHWGCSYADHKPMQVSPTPRWCRRAT